MSIEEELSLSILFHLFSFSFSILLPFSILPPFLHPPPFLHLTSLSPSSLPFSYLCLSLSSLPLSLPSLIPSPLSHTQHTTGQLQIYQARIASDLRTEVWKVEGVATVEIEGGSPPRYVFDCNTTLNNGSGVRWTRLDESHLGLTVRPLTNGKRLDAGMLVHQNLGNYSCWDERTGERLTLLITDSKNTDPCSGSFSAASWINRTLPT